MMKEFMQQTQAGIQAAIQASIQTAIQSTVQAAIVLTNEAAMRERDQMKREQTEFMERMERMIEESIPPARASEEPTPMVVDDSVPAALRLITKRLDAIQKENQGMKQSQTREATFVRAELRKANDKLREIQEKSALERSAD